MRVVDRWGVRGGGLPTAVAEIYWWGGGVGIAKKTCGKKLRADWAAFGGIRPRGGEARGAGGGFSARAGAFLTGLEVAVYKSLEESSKLWQSDARFKPAMKVGKADALYAGWRDAVERVKSQ